MANQNPIRYRGYYYDTESGLYYLNSRYYDPVTGRFVNADGYVSTGQDITGFNMFAYCGNNPVMYKDDSGESFSAAIGFGILLVGMLLTLSASDSDTIQNQGSSTDSVQIAAGRGKEFTPRKDPRKGSENRQKSGDRERNVAHPDGEEHSRVAKGSNGFVKKAVAGVSIAALSIAVVYLVANDVTGVGAADDAMIPVFSKAIWDLAQIF